MFHMEKRSRNTLIIIIINARKTRYCSELNETKGPSQAQEKQVCAGSNTGESKVLRCVKYKRNGIHCSIPFNKTALSPGRNSCVAPEVIVHC